MLTYGINSTITIRFLVRLLGIGNFQEKVFCLQQYAHFQENFPSLKQHIHSLDIAYKVQLGWHDNGCLSVICSLQSLFKPHEKLSQVLALVLMTGNKMNADSSSRSNASAFKLDILTELKDVRSNDGSTNLLKFIVQSYIDCHPVRLAMKNLLNTKSTLGSW